MSILIFAWSCAMFLLTAKFLTDCEAELCDYDLDSDIDWDNFTFPKKG